MSNRLDAILKAKKVAGISWEQLAEELPITANAIRVAFSRKSVDDAYLEILEKHLGIDSIEYITKAKNLKNIVGVSDIEPSYDLSNTIDSILSDKNKLSELLRAMIRKYDNLMEDEFFQVFAEKSYIWMKKQRKEKEKEAKIREIQQDAKELYNKDKEVNK